MIARLMFLIATLATLAGAAPAAAQAAPPASSPNSATAPPTLQPGPEQGVGPPISRGPGLEYRLGAGDKIRIIIYGEEALSGEFFVAGSGKVSLPLIGDVQAANLSVQDFQNEIANALKQGYLKEPRVSAEVLSYRPYYILGEVNKPGEYPYSNGLNVLNAVATAGGFTYRAQTKRVFIRRSSETKEQPYPLTSDIPVSPGDTIRITERFF
jgi:protein involved in polysaccharide export with SLBB domain